MAKKILQVDRLNFIPHFYDIKDIKERKFRPKNEKNTCPVLRLPAGRKDWKNIQKQKQGKLLHVKKREFH